MEPVEALSDADELATLLAVAPAVAAGFRRAVVVLDMVLPAEPGLAVAVEPGRLVALVMGALLIGAREVEAVADGTALRAVTEGGGSLEEAGRGAG